ncbi:uncharacterized protein LOC115258215 [Aedes albopictus]|uniref:Uncharacterized protein n=1 Tax=Aedes albopictus TaxID=7160 RepID=A0ABM1ZJY8_AEDAL
MSGRKSGKDGKSGSKGARSKEKQSEAIDISGGDNVVVVVTEEEQDPKDVFRKDRDIEQNCTFCQERDSDEMVQCDKCDRWIHFACVGVTEEIADKSWSCPKCVTTTGFQQPSSSAVNRGRAGSSGHPGQLGAGKSVRCNTLSEPAGRTFPTGAANCDKTVKSVSSSSSRRSILQLQLQRLEEEREYEKIQAEKHRAYMDRKYELLEQMQSQTGSECSRSQDRVRQWVRDTNNAPAENALDPRATEFFDPQRHSTQNYSGQAQVGSIPPTNQFRHSQDRNEGPYVRCGPRREQPFRPMSTSRSLVEAFEQLSHQQRRTDLHSGRLEEDFEPCSFSRQQLAARQGISKDLPKFSGKFEEWPVFMSMFNSTTNMCGFTNEENLIRLQKSLEGKAYETAQSLLMHPSNVPAIMRTLKMRFGQPEAVVHSLIQKVNALPPIQEDRLETLVEFAVSVQNFCATVDAYELEDYMYNVSLLHQLVNKLPATLKLDWARHRQNLQRVNLATFGNWAYSLAEAASTVVIPIDSNESRQSRNDGRGNKKSNAYVNAHSDTNLETCGRFISVESDADPRQGSYASVSKPLTYVTDGCVVCKGGCKSTSTCKQFLELSRESRWAIVREFKLCRSCLRRHKGGCDAKSCGRNGCTYKHHELLHNDQNAKLSSNQVTQIPPTSQVEAPRQQEAVPVPTHDCNTHQTKSSAVLFRYLPVILNGPQGSIHTYAFLDEGSHLSLIDQELADQLNLKGANTPLFLRWTGGTQRCEKDSKSVTLHISGTDKMAKNFQLSGVRTVEELMLPEQTLNVEQLKYQYPHLKGLPIDSYYDARPRILIGMKHVQVSLVLKSREGSFGDPVAVKTRLGWAVCGGGNAEGNESGNLVHYTFHVCSCERIRDDELHQAVKQHFALDSLGIMKPGKLLLSAEDQRAQALMKQLTTYDGERYTAGLLWRHDNIRLPDNYAMALRRHQCLQKRLAKDPELAGTLHRIITEYVSKGYIRQLSENELSRRFPRVWYLPIFPVVNPNKPGKVRIIWDCAACSFGISLNSALLKGPDQLCSLLTILLQFREKRVGLTGDIREMFHQVRIHDEDQQCQRFLWRNEKGETLIYVMQVMTFGACCSPSCAQYVKNSNAERYAAKFPKAVEVIQKKHYVDDMLTSLESEEEAVRIAKEVKFIHQKGGFEIRNWISNSPTVLRALNEKGMDEKDLDLSPEIGTEKVLGMWWCTATDTFTYKVGWKRYDSALLKGQRHPTKREVLRVLMSIFDPLGLITHFLMFLKMLLQEVWRSGVQWDEEITEDAFAKWQQWLEVLPQVEQVQVPRCYTLLSHNSEGEAELHTFADASECGMSAVAFLRFVRNGSIECRIVAAKTRVAPLKFVSIPRLELQAAVVGSRLACTIEDSLSIAICRKYYWTDSRDALCWLNSDHRRYTQYVAFRVSEILETTEANEWRWVPSKMNVADDGTKWSSKPDLTPDSRWFKGPEFLWQSETYWPKQPMKNSSTAEELRPSLIASHIPCEPAINPSKFSSWKRMLNVTALVLRFPANCSRKLGRTPTTTGSPTAVELNSAEAYLLRSAQRDSYPEEMAHLEKSRQNSNISKTVSKQSSLFQLTPWLDGRGLMRMRTRIAACHYATEDAKNPIILPRDHPTTNLIISHYHRQFHHQNHEAVVNELRQRFKIPRIRAAYAKMKKNCQRCKNDHVSPRPPIMADLPPARLAAYSPPFTHTGIDFFGPYEVAVGRRVEKRWGMLATCLTIRAIHIEVVHSLTTDSCIMAIRNFISRRGTPSVIYSDRGTNFIGASRRMKEAAAAVNVDEVVKEFITVDTTWSFNPPLAPHMGGSWERLIGSVKRNLQTINPPRNPTDEVLRNLMIEIENIINSRPLTHVPVDDDCAPALTPNHFLLGSSNGIKPFCTLDDTSAALRQNILASQILANRFWKRWLSDYLPEITKRSKWFNQTDPVTVGDLVVIADPKLPRNCWPKGKVIEVHPGRDREVRSATVRTSAGVYVRAVTKLAVLDVRREGSKPAERLAYSGGV